MEFMIFLSLLHRLLGLQACTITPSIVIVISKNCVLARTLEILSSMVQETDVWGSI